MLVKNNKDPIKELKKFGLVMTIAFGVLGGLCIWRQKTGAIIPLFVISGSFATLALIKPTLLGPIETAWMRLAGVISAVMTRVIMTITFFVLITPLGLLMRLFGKSPLELHFDTEKTSYWDPVEENGPGTRPYHPY